MPDEHGSESREHESELDAAFAKLKRRCKKAGIKAFVASDAVTGRTLEIWFDRGKGVKPVRVRNLEHANALLSSEFDCYRVLRNYEAIWSPGDGTIEAAIGTIGFGPWGGSGKDVLLRLMRETSIKCTNGTTSRLEIHSGGAERHIYLQDMSGNLLALFPRNELERPSLLLTGFSTSSPEVAADLLVRIADSLFFQIDHAIGLTLGLRRIWPFPPSAPPPQRPRSDLKFPEQQFDSAPMECYWYAKSAFDMPDLQFLLFYQIIEFYFPENLNTRASRASLMESTLKSIENELHSFINSDKEMKAFFDDKTIYISGKETPLQSKAENLRVPVAAHIVKLRNNIAHSRYRRLGDEDANLPPRARYERNLDLDVKLIQFVAKNLLIVKAK